MDVVRPQFVLRAPEYRDSRLFRYSYLENPPNSVFRESSKNWRTLRPKFLRFISKLMQQFIKIFYPES